MYRVSKKNALLGPFLKPHCAQQMPWETWKGPILSSFPSRVQWWPCFWPKTAFRGSKKPKTKNCPFFGGTLKSHEWPKKPQKIWFFGADPSHRMIRSCSRPKKKVLNHFLKKYPVFCTAVKKPPKSGFFQSHFSTPKWGFWKNPRPPLNRAQKTVQEKVVSESLIAHFHNTARAPKL